MLSRTPLFLFAFALATGCRVSGPVSGPTAVISPTREPALAPESVREIMAKRAPDELIARDGTACRVAPDVYGSTSVGSMFRCRWLRG